MYGILGTRQNGWTESTRCLRGGVLLCPVVHNDYASSPGANTARIQCLRTADHGCLRKRKNKNKKKRENTFTTAHTKLSALNPVYWTDGVEPPKLEARSNRFQAISPNVSSRDPVHPQAEQLCSVMSIWLPSGTEWKRKRRRRERTCCPKCLTSC